jgi:hypothetical protein
MRHGFVATPCATRGFEKTPGVCPRVLLPATVPRNRHGPWLGEPPISPRLPLRAAGPTPPFRSRAGTVENRHQFSRPSLPRLPLLTRCSRPEIEERPRLFLDAEHCRGFCATATRASFSSALLARNCSGVMSPSRRRSSRRRRNVRKLVHLGMYSS